LAYDDFGQLVSFTDATGAVSRTTRDSRDRPATVTWTGTDGVTVVGSQSFTYTDPTGADRRGLLASVTDTGTPGVSGSGLGTITATYDEAGALTSQSLTSGPSQSFSYDTTGDAVATRWADSATNELLTDSQVSDVHGRWREQTVTGAHPGWTSRSFSYDPAGRLLTVEELAGDDAATCRTYGWDVNSNRTSATTHPAAGDGTCTPTGAATATQSLSCDVADRLLPVGAAAGTGYDAWGRVTSQPGGLTASPTAGAATVTYHANDLVASLSQAGTTRSWSLDPAQRLATVTVSGAGSGQLVNHYSDPATDSPTWTLDTTSGTAVTRRYVPGLVGLFAEITTTGTAATTSVQLTGLHGDVLRTTSPGATGSPDGPGINADEFGIIRDDTGTTVPGPRYGWLGGKQRAVDTGTAGLTLMGVRLYAPAIGRFLSTDPVYGGNANTYTYPADPITSFDYDGRSICRGCFGGAMRFTRRVRSKTLDVGISGWRTVTSAANSAVESSRSVASFVRKGKEFVLRDGNVRIAPFGNRTGHPLGRYPHYHRRGPKGADGQTVPGQGIGRHRPWEKGKTDMGFWDRF
jgi:RHS repeat-associated protein